MDSWHFTEQFALSCQNLFKMEDKKLFCEIPICHVLYSVWTRMTLSVSFSPADPERYLSPTDLGTMRKIFIHFYISFSAIPLLLPCPALRGNALFLISPWFLLPNRRQCVLLSIPAKHFIFPVRSFSFSFGSAALRLPSLPCPLHSLGDHCHTTSQKPPSSPPSSLRVPGHWFLI